MKKGYKQLLSLFILASIVNIILCQGFSTGANHETGIKTLILKNLPHECHDDFLCELSFQIAFQASYAPAPLAIVSLLGIGRPMEDLQAQNKNRQLLIKLAQVSTLPKGIKIQVQSTLKFGTMKVSYLFIDRFLSEKFGIGLITYHSPQNQKLIRDEGNYLNVN